MRAAGYGGGDILDINQVTANFAYANRTVPGLRCSIEGDIPGLSPSRPDDPGNWSHSLAGRRTETGNRAVGPAPPGLKSRLADRFTRRRY